MQSTWERDGVLDSRIQLVALLAEQGQTLITQPHHHLLHNMTVIESVVPTLFQRDQLDNGASLVNQGAQRFEIGIRGRPSVLDASWPRTERSARHPFCPFCRVAACFWQST